MTHEEFERIKDVRDKIERYEDILQMREKHKTTGYAFPKPSSFCIEPILFRINDPELNFAIDELVRKKLQEAKMEFDAIKTF